MDFYVISGGPATGKTSLINELEKKGYFVLKEVARRVANFNFAGKNIKQINMKDFHKKIFEIQKKEYIEMKESKKQMVFSDRGIGDTLAYFKFYNLSIPSQFFNSLREIKYSRVFILDKLDFYKKDFLRQENEFEQRKIHELIIETYKELNYPIVFVPLISIKKRADFILDKIQNP